MGGCTKGDQESSLAVDPVTVLESIHLGLHVGIVECRRLTQVYALCPSSPILVALHMEKINIHYHLLQDAHLPFTFFSLP